jgi:micrococcal nuclease
MRRVILLGVAVLAFLSVSPASLQTPPQICVVERVVDGDTIYCGGDKVRLLLIDAPEENQGPFGRAAQAFLEAILPMGSQAELQMDIEDRDQYGRLLAYVYRPDGRMVNTMMVRQGFAVPYTAPPNVQYIDTIRAAGDSARAQGIGLWAVQAFQCAPEAFRKGNCLVEPGAPIGTKPSQIPGTLSSECDHSYPDVCIPPPPPDLDCTDVPHKRFRVMGEDPHRFDGNHDGVGCEGPPPRP